MHEIEYAKEADAPALAKINVEAFQGRLLLGQVFPESTQSMLQVYKTHAIMKYLVDPDIHVVKTYHDDGELVAYARWQLPACYGQSQATLSEQAALSAQDPMVYAPKPMNTEAFAAFREYLDEGRQKYTTEDDMVLRFLATLPEYQGQGHGTALLKWGIEKADATKSRIFLEATPEGVPIYLKLGWRHVGEFTIDFAEYGGVGAESFYFMIRDPVS